MGREKDRLIEEEERGWRSVTHRYVCDNCISEPGLADYIRDRGVQCECGYCGLTPEDADLRCLPFDDVMAQIAAGIYSEFNDADKENIPYESGEGGYQFSEHIYTTYELLMDVIGLDASERVFEDVLRALPDCAWCSKDFYSLSLGEALDVSWNTFTEKVKHETRYLFTLPEQQEDSKGIAPARPDVMSGDSDFAFAASAGDPEFGIEYDRQEGIPAYQMLDTLGQLVRRLRLFRVLTPSTVLYRVLGIGEGNSALSK